MPESESCGAAAARDVSNNYCTQCCESVSQSAAYCPFCGHPIRRKESDELLPGNKKPGPLIDQSIGQGTPSRQAWLMRTCPGGPDVSIALGGRDTLVGLDTDNDLVITDDRYVSRRHARIRCDSGMLLLEDVGSLNGTFLRVREGCPLEVRPGDEIRIGSSILRVVEHPEGGPELPRG